MRYPAFLKKGDTIGLIAPSFGVFGYPYEDRFDNAYKKFSNLGYRIKEVEHLRGAEKCRSTTDEQRAREFMEMYLDVDTDFIFSVAGGELMMTMLPYIDFETLGHAKPKFVMGYSDNTNLTFTLPILADTAAIYGSNFGSFGMRNWHQSLQQSYDLITGSRLKFESYESYEIVDLSKEEGKALCGYNLTEEVLYKSLSGERKVEMTGRLIGGCLDILLMLCGTKFGQVNDFLEKYKEDGFIWYLESYDLNVLAQSRGLWQLKQAGWFKYCKGILYGRTENKEDIFDYTFEDALKENLTDLNCPVIYDCDIGHLPPSWPIISGAVAKFVFEDGKAAIEYYLR
ncbi:MAG TPA: LD-carboxypeptidase [Erysipelotrichaceae bacterium]|nr:LD-carboxypeptidase [Erysipelotrichaceae bacterium]HQB32556.1 LD-carboxypeptidase [Erysipelotrichaceae bacterium]